MRLRTCALIAFVLLGLAGCLPRWGKGATHHDSSRAQAQLLADGQAGEVVFAPPVDDPPDILEQYRFAPGDRVDLKLYGQPEFDQPDTVVDPDGNVHFSIARNIPAVGRTVVELRGDLELRMTELVLRPRAVVQPRSTIGHRYYVLGTVSQQGPFPIDRPVRVLDAIARAGGIATGLQDNATVEIADFARSVLVRRGEVMAIDFQALIQTGDLRYNILLHPGDLMIFPSTVAGEIYVLGAVPSQGAQPYAPDLTVVGLLTRRGGLLERAYRRQIAVLRGNLTRPRIYLVDLDDVLSARAKDFRIEPGDIIYVPDRPFQYLRELALTATRAFVGVLGARAGGQATDHLFGD